MKTSCGKFLNLAHYFPYDVKLRLLAHSRSFLANQKARNAIVGAEILLKLVSHCFSSQRCLKLQWSPDFSNLQGKRKLVWKIAEFEKSGGKLQCLTEEGNDFWFEFSGDSKT